MIEIIVVVGYTLSLLLIFLFSLGQLNLTIYYIRKKKSLTSPGTTQMYSTDELPVVTVQLPIYNELYVVERLIKAVTNFDYPKEKWEIQVLDDSTDTTKNIVSDLVSKLHEQGVDIKHLIRPNRTDFKAGALQYGLERSKGDLLAVFDADFLPGKDFLLKTVPYFMDESIGAVQTRWGHINRDYSLLTKLQAFGLDAHFSVEQVGRNSAGSFINFNGTAGILRKKCIIHAGGWSADTLTEDLDLSYRAQMKGWKFKYLEDVEAPAELPVIMTAIKSQQYRWNKGAAENVRKNLYQVLRSNLNFINKVHAIFHLFNSSIYVCLLIAALLSIPMLFIKFSNPAFNFYFNLGSIFLFGFFSIGYFYWVATKYIGINKTMIYYLKTFLGFLIISMGLSLHNTFAVLEGLIGFKTPFVRTPKFNIKNQEDSWKGNIYIRPKITFLTILEGILSLYFFFGIYTGIILQDYGLIFFHLMLALGFAAVFFYSLIPVKYGLTRGQ